jgi:OFA family oxalate/formate antiporter-like MFS transporter
MYKSTLAHFPFSPKRFPFFYGWVILTVGAVGQIMSAPGQTIGIAPFTEHLILALHLSRDQLCIAYFIGTMASAFALPFAGICLDYFGARIIGPLASFSLGVILILLSFSENLIQSVQQYFMQINPTLITLTIFSIMIFMLRFSGQGVLILVSRNMTMKWFDQYRGIACGISGVLVTFGYSLYPQIANKAIELYSWQESWRIMSLMGGIGFTVIALIFYRDTPESCDLLPDGITSIDDIHDDAIHFYNHVQLTCKEALKTYAFWIFTIALSMHSLCYSAATFHINSIFQEASLPTHLAFGIYVKIAFVSVSINLIGGWLSDNIQLKYLLIVLLFGLVSYLFGLTHLEARHYYWLLIIGCGTANGIFFILVTFAWPKFFGRKHLGAISSIFLSISVMFSAIGPFTFSYSLSQTESYNTICYICIVINLALIVCALYANNPQINKAATK